jgi:colanic acid biosynthesis glycosyl transferase WcaI
MAKPRLILVNRVYWPSTAATAQLLTDLAEGLAARGWTVHVLAAGEASSRHNGVTIHRTGGSDRHGGLWSRLADYRHFRRAARHQLKALVEPGDVVVAMTDPPLLGGAIAQTVAARGGALIHWVQDIYPEIATVHFGALAGVVLAPFRSRRDTSWRAARSCVTLGEDMAQMLAGRGVPSNRVVTVSNWAPRELDQPAPPEAIAARRAAWGVTDKFVVAYSGNLGRVHEFAAVLAAAGRLRDHRDVVFLFIGAGARFEEIRAAAQRDRLDNIRLLPPEPRANLAAALAAADAQLVTLKPEFAGLVYPSKLAGVFAAGRPVLFVGPPGGEIARLLEREHCGAAFGPHEGDRLADEIAQWAADPARCREAGRRARIAYEKQFTFAAALTRWEELLQTAPDATLSRNNANEGGAH